MMAWTESRERLTRAIAALLGKPPEECTDVADCVEMLAQDIALARIHQHEQGKHWRGR
jgi:hypothetical protein